MFNLRIFSFDEFSRYMELYQSNFINPLDKVVDNIKKLGKVTNKKGWTKRAKSMEGGVYYVYILELISRDGIKSYYTGYSNNLHRGISQHRDGRGSILTQNKKIELKYFETFIGRSKAVERKKEIQQLSDEEIIKLIKSIE